MRNRTFSPSLPSVTTHNSWTINYTQEHHETWRPLRFIYGGIRWHTEGGAIITFRQDLAQMLRGLSSWSIPLATIEGSLLAALRESSQHFDPTEYVHIQYRTNNINTMLYLLGSYSKHGCERDDRTLPNRMNARHTNRAWDDPQHPRPPDATAPPPNRVVPLGSLYIVGCGLELFHGDDGAYRVVPWWKHQGRGRGVCFNTRLGTENVHDAGGNGVYQGRHERDHMRGAGKSSAHD